jgi:hypothetical protein
LPKTGNVFPLALGNVGVLVGKVLKNVGNLGNVNNLLASAKF